MTRSQDATEITLSSTPQDQRLPLTYSTALKNYYSAKGVVCDITQTDLAMGVVVVGEKMMERW